MTGTKYACIMESVRRSDTMPNPLFISEAVLRASLQTLQKPNVNQIDAPIPTLAPAVSRPRAKKIDPAAKGEVLHGTDIGVKHVLREMRSRSGVSFGVLAKRMGVEMETVRQYFKDKRGSGRMSIAFLTKFAEACGSRIKVEYPDRDGE